MRGDKNFYYTLTIIFFIVCFVAAFILGNRTIEIGNLVATASVIFYPMTYFIAVLFAERYGKEKVFSIFALAIFSLILFVLMLTVANTLPIYGGYDGLDKVFNVDYRLVFASIAAFFVSQNLNLNIYYFLDKSKKLNFLISGVIAITVDSLIFVTLTFLGETSFKEVLKIFSGQYVLGTIMMMVYALCFIYLIDSVIANRKVIALDEENELVITEEKVKAKPKIAPKKTTTSKKEPNKATKTTTIKKGTNKAIKKA